jgi:WD40 repeat protein
MKQFSILKVLLLSVIIISCSPIVTPTQNFSVSSKIETSAPITPSESLTNETVLIDSSLSASGVYLAVYTNIGIYIYNTTTMEKMVVEEFSHDQEINSKIRFGAIAIRPNEELIATSGLSADTPVRLINLITKNKVGEIRDIPNGYYVTQLQFSPDGNYLYIRSEYPQSMHCTHNGTDTSFALFKIQSDASFLQFSKVFEKEGCVNLSPYSKVRFTNDDKFFLYIEQDMSSALAYLVDLTLPSNFNERTFGENLLPYDISSDGNILAVFKPNNNGQELTTLVDLKSNNKLGDIPYMVKLLDDSSHYLVRGDIYNESEWGLLKNGSVICNYKGLVYPFHFIWELSANNEVFISSETEKEILIWDVATCSIKNVLNLK